MLSFAEKAGCTRIISPETLIVEEAGIDIFCIGNTDAARGNKKTGFKAAVGFVFAANVMCHAAILIIFMRKHNA